MNRVLLQTIKRGKVSRLSRKLVLVTHVTGPWAEATSPLWPIRLEELQYKRTASVRERGSIDQKNRTAAVVATWRPVGSFRFLLHHSSYLHPLSSRTPSRTYIPFLLPIFSTKQRVVLNICCNFA